MNNGKGYITESEWQEWKRNKDKKKDFQEYCQIKGCGKPSIQAVITHEDNEKNICSECLKKYFKRKYSWETEKWYDWETEKRRCCQLTDHKTTKSIFSAFVKKLRGILQILLNSILLR